MKLSVIIPVYNNFNQLSKCFASLSKQTVFGIYQDQVEVIIIDDGSSEEFKQNKLNTQLDIKHFKIEHSGAAVARNTGFDKSAGEYIFFCDADVIFLKKNALEKMIKILEGNLDAVYVYSGFKYGSKKMPSFVFDGEKLRHNNYISTMSLIRRDKFPGFDESLKRFQDWDLWLTLLEKGETGVWIPEILWQAKTRGTMSSWLPTVFYRLFKNSKKVKEFNNARQIIIDKHHF